MTAQPVPQSQLTRFAPATPDREQLSERGYTAPELMRLTGMTRKQVTYWERIGLVQPTLRDTNAAPAQPALYYSSREALRALIVCELRRSGFSTHQVQQVAKNLGELDVELVGARTYLLTDGHSVYYAFSEHEVVDVFRNHRQQLMLIPIHEQVARLREVA